MMRRLLELAAVAGAGVGARMSPIDQTQWTRTRIFVRTARQVELGVVGGDVRGARRVRGVHSVRVVATRLADEIGARRTAVVLGALALPRRILGHEAHDLLAALARHNGAVADALEQRVAFAQEAVELGAPAAAESPRKDLVLVLVDVLLDVAGQVERQVEVDARELVQIELGSLEVGEHHGQCVLHTRSFKLTTQFYQKLELNTELNGKCR